ncbi:uncharacterized protein LOC131163123 [Malania oleifera]|uniref:uncharacterized protein LOC131163123 n=1 Tax=Malania oleifera TaxID=397392 RepID=UPI0025ADC2CC|nr:uncharacterized protein LOC131163123 [Malania oleifera]
MLGRATGNQGNKQSHGKKEKPVCSHCGLLGHTAEICYKVHGYPPSYKSRYKHNAPSANQVILTTNTEQSSEVQHLPFTQEQLRQIMAIMHPSPEIQPQPSVAQVTKPFTHSTRSFSEDHLFSTMTGPTDTWRMIGLGEEKAGLYHLLYKHSAMSVSNTTFNKNSLLTIPASFFANASDFNV